MEPWPLRCIASISPPPGPPRVPVPEIEKRRCECGPERSVGAGRVGGRASAAGGAERPYPIDPFPPAAGGGKFVGPRAEAMGFPETVGLARRGRKKAIAD